MTTPIPATKETDLAKIEADKAKLAEEKAAKAKADKEAKEAKKQADKEAKEAAKLAQKEAKEKEKAEKAEVKKAEQERKKAEREANRMPMQNGVRRPRAEGKCGQAWAIFDEITAKKGSPTSIAEALEVARSKGLNESNVRCEYASWKKFNGIKDRISAPAKEKPVKEPKVAKEPKEPKTPKATAPKLVKPQASK